MANTKSKTKATKQSASKSKSAKPKATKRSAAKPKAKTKKAAEKNPVSVKRAKLATEMVTQATATDKRKTGSAIARAPISVPKVELVQSKLLRSGSAAQTIKSVGFKSTAEAERYASGKIGRADLSPEINRALTEAAAKLGDPKVHKINGRALAAVLVAATK